MEEYKLALLLREEGKFDEGRALLEKSAAQGYAHALRELENMYHSGGWGAHRNFKNALFLSDNYPNAFGPLSMNSLRILVQEHQFGVATELLALQLEWVGYVDESHKLMEAAAEKGSASACYSLSRRTDNIEKRQ